MSRRLLAAMAVFISACSVGPNYKRPAIVTPPAFRAPEPLPNPSAPSLANLKWFEVFRDDQLQALIRTALKHTHGRKNDAAVRLGIGRNTITRKIAELGIDGAKDD